MVDIQKTLYRVADFVSWCKEGTLVLTPEFQRRAVWKAGTKSYFIDSIVRGLPIPIIFLRERGATRTGGGRSTEVVDGQQRLRTVLSYIDPSLLSDYNPRRDDFTVQGAHNEELAGKRFKDLSPELQKRILDYRFDVHVLPGHMEQREVIDIFRRMNTTSYRLNHQEFRNAEYFGEFKSSMHKLAGEQLHRWRDWRTFTEDNIARMLEVELTSEFVLLMLKGEIRGRNQAAIDKVYAEFDEEFPQRGEVERRFRIVMDTLDEQIGPEMKRFPFARRFLIYSLLAYFYDVLFGLGSSLDQKMKPKPISADRIERIKQAGAKVRAREAPEKVLRAATRRITNPGDRKVLFEYLHGR